MIATVERVSKLRVTRLIKAPRERVFAAWTTPAEIMKSFGPETCRVLAADINLRAGGEYRLRFQTETFGEIELHGVYREVRRPAKLVFTWNWSGNPKLESGESVVTLDFLDRTGSTEVQITHDGLPSEEIKQDHTEGWNGCLDKLEKYLGGGEEKLQHRIVWCDIPVTDLDRAIRFYSALLGMPVTKHEEHGMTFALLPHKEHEVGGCLVSGGTSTEGMKPSANGPMVYVSCQGRLDEALNAVVPNGGKVLKPKHQIGPYGSRAIVLDSEGNRIALHST